MSKKKNLSEETFQLRPYRHSDPARIRKPLFFYLCAAILLVCIIRYAVLQKNQPQETPPPLSIQEVSMSQNDEPPLCPPSVSASEPTTTPGNPSDKPALLYRQNPLFVLVNKNYALPDDYDARLRTICNGRLQASSYLYDDLCSLLAAGAEAGYGYWIASAYRSPQRQQALVDEDVAAYMAQGYSRQEALAKTYLYTMPAGYSEHHTGLALDILCSTNQRMDETQADEPGNAWLQAHCHEFGFILRYPAHKEDVTGIRYEPWHFRYVGKDAAAYIAAHDLVLEEYCQF